jgi:hypothetical protein
MVSGNTGLGQLLGGYAYDRRGNTDVLAALSADKVVSIGALTAMGTLPGSKTVAEDCRAHRASTAKQKIERRASTADICVL